MVIKMVIENDLFKWSVWHQTPQIGGHAFDWRNVFVGPSFDKHVLAWIGKRAFWHNICVAKRHISPKRINQIDLNLYSPKKKMYCIQKTVVINEMRQLKKKKRREQKN